VAFSPDGRLVASGVSLERDPGSDPLPEIDDGIRVWSVVTGEEARRLSGSNSTVTSLAFSPDGTRLASGLRNSTVLFWEVPPAPNGHRGEGPSSGPKDVQALWADLAGTDARKAHTAVWALADSSRATIAFLTDRLQPWPEPDVERIKRLIADLDSDRFAVREQAAQNLRQFGESAVPLLNDALTKQPTVETRQRLEQLIERAEAPLTSGEALRALRAVEVLERIGTPEAQQWLRRLAGGAPAARVTRAAQASLDRLRRQP
jgi:hypothetical protein